MKYNKKMFLEYASAFDYTQDFHYSAEQSGKPITWEQAKKQNDEYMKSMENWSLKDFQKHFDFRKFDIDENEQANDNYKEKMKKKYYGLQVHTLTFLKVDENGDSIDDKQYEYTGDHSGFCDGIEDEYLKELDE